MKFVVALLISIASLGSGQRYFGHGPGPEYHPEIGYSSYPTSPYGTPPQARRVAPKNPFQILFGHDPTSSVEFPSQLFQSQNFPSNLFAGHHQSSGSENGPHYLPRYSPAPASSAPACVVKAPPKIDWGDCPSLEPKEEDKKKKEEKMKECLKDLEVNENSTVDSLSKPLQEKAKECVYRKDELLNAAGKFNYDKAAEKLKEKSLPEKVQKKVEEAHVECKIEAESKFLNLNQILAEVNSYQDCMDFHLAMLCNIKIVKPTPTNLNNFHGLQQLPSQSPSNFHHLANVGPNVGEIMDRIDILSQALRK